MMTPEGTLEQDKENIRIIWPVPFVRVCLKFTAMTINIPSTKYDFKSLIKFYPTTNANSI